jgi:hypothetical protein
VTSRTAGDDEPAPCPVDPHAGGHPVLDIDEERAGAAAKVPAVDVAVPQRPDVEGVALPDRDAFGLEIVGDRDRGRSRRRHRRRDEQRDDGD